MHGDGDDTDEPKSISIAAERPVYNCLCMRSAPLKAMDDYHLLFSLRPSEQLFLNHLHLIWEGGLISVFKVKVVPEKC